VKILGIDPGKKGALVFLSDNGDVDIYDMPDLEKYVTGAISQPDLCNILKTQRPDAAIVEVAECFLNGRKSAFTIGLGYGILLALLKAMDITIYTIRARTWKANMNLTSDKDLSRYMAKRLYPDYAQYLEAKGDDGRAEALLLARYGLDRIKGNEQCKTLG
jgi:crossover junction endodeoxyribonuclease RuvC